jgi:hypothetical protein
MRIKRMSVTEEWHEGGGTLVGVPTPDANNNIVYDLASFFGGQTAGN